MRELETIRRAELADLPAVLQLLDEVDELHRSALPWLFRKVAEARSTAFLEQYVSKPDHAMLLACAGSGVIAGAIYLFIRQPARAPIVQPASIAEIDALVVGRAFRRRGVGKRLVEAALDWGKQQGATRTELGVYEFNAAAQAFWLSVGFETLSRRLVLLASHS